MELSDEVLALKILSRLTPRDIASVGSVCRRFYELTKNEDLWRLVCQNAWGSETTQVLETVSGAKQLGWGRLAREFTTLEALAWRKLTVGGIVEPSRCNFSACAVGSRVVLFGGEGVNMQPINDTFVLDLNSCKPEWQHFKILGCFSATPSYSIFHCKDLYGERYPVTLAPPSRLGHSLSVYGGRKILMSGGLAKSGPLRFRSSDVFTMDLSEEEPCWRSVTGSCMPGSGNPGGIAPPPRLDHVALNLPGGRIVVFGGSVAGLHSASQLYILDPMEEKPTWRILNVPGRPPKFAWGHSTCVVGGTRVIVLGGQTGEEWMLGELHELSLASSVV